MMGNLLEKFKRADSNEAELREAVKHLGKADELPGFWGAIANDSSMPLGHRRLALIQLVRRHVVPGNTTIGTFADMLAGAPWLRQNDLAIIAAIGGKIPVKWSPDDTVAVISLPGNHGAIYLTIAGRFTAEEIAGALRRILPDKRVRAAIIRDVGFQFDD